MKDNANNTQVVPDSLETLRELFKPHLKLPKARMTCLLMLVLAVIAERTVSLVWLSKHPDTEADSRSVYRRFQRFFALCRLPSKAVGRLVLALVPKPDDGWILAMDRTNWQFGRTHVNILVVSVILGGVGLPVAWRVLPKSTKRGNSNKTHRIAVMEELLLILPADDIRALTMDREFVGKGWLAWLRLTGVCYVVRLKKNARVAGLQVSFLCERNRWKRCLGEGLVEVFGERVGFAAKRIRRGREPYLAVISHGFGGPEALAIYRRRWGIETLFGHLKKKGYQFEDTHMTKAGRIGKLMGVLTIAFVLCYRWGAKLEERNGAEIKKHGYRAKSLFRQGFESLHAMIQKPWRWGRKLREFLDVIVRRPLVGNFVGQSRI